MIATVTIGFIVTVAIVLLNLYVDVVVSWRILRFVWSTGSPDVAVSICAEEG